MDNWVIPEDMPTIIEQQNVLAARGHQVTTDELILESIRRMLELTFDQKLEGHYFAVEQAGLGYNVIGFDRELEGQVIATDKMSFVEMFKTLPIDFVWDYLDAAADKVIKR